MNKAVLQTQGRVTGWRFDTIPDDGIFHANIRRVLSRPDKKRFDQLQLCLRHNVPYDKEFCMNMVKLFTGTEHVDFKNYFAKLYRK